MRPLLTVSKKRDFRLSKKIYIQYIKDDSNLNSDFDRNYLRNEIFPMLEKVE